MAYSGCGPPPIRQKLVTWNSLRSMSSLDAPKLIRSSATNAIDAIGAGPLSPNQSLFFSMIYVETMFTCPSGTRSVLQPAEHTPH